MKNMKKKKGFTLIELIVVIAILAIIAVLAIPSFNSLKDSSAEQIAKANARTVYTAAAAALAVDADGTITVDDIYNIMGSGSGIAKTDIAYQHTAESKSGNTVTPASITVKVQTHVNNAYYTVSCKDGVVLNEINKSTTPAQPTIVTETK